MTRSRDEIELDLPFLVNGTLDAEARAEIEAALAEDPHLAAEHEALSAIRSGMQAEDMKTPGEFGLARLMRDVDRQTARAADHRADAGGARRGIAPFRSRTTLWQAMAAVAVLGIVAQSYFLRPATNLEVNVAPAGYVLAGSEERGALLVGFAAGATEAAIRGLLLDAELEIVAGPSALGLYRLDVLDGADVETATGLLRSAEGIVESVENVRN